MSSTIPRISRRAPSPPCSFVPSTRCRAGLSSMTFPTFALDFFGRPMEIVLVICCRRDSVRTVQFPCTPLAGNVGWAGRKKTRVRRRRLAVHSSANVIYGRRGRDTHGGRAKKLTVFADPGGERGRPKNKQGF